jgi:predicted GNAT family acetyltransferase
MEFTQTPGRIYACGPNETLLAEVTFPVAGGVANINHTFVDPSLRGQSIAGQLLAAAVEQIRDNGWKARPTCSYAVKWFSQHPEASDLLEDAP